MVEYLPSGVVYAATEDLPAAARQVIEGLQDPGSLGPGVEWRGPGPAAPDVDVAVAWDEQAQAVAYSVRGQPERTVALDDLNQALAQDWDHYRQDVEAAGQLLERLDAITTPAGLDAEEMEVAFSPTRRTVTAQITVEPDFTPDDVLTQGMRGELMIEETGQGAQLQLEGAPTTGSLTDEHARQLLSHAVGDARRDPGITAWRQVHPRTAAFRDQGLVVEDPIVNRTGSASVLVRTQRAALEPMSIYGEQAVAFAVFEQVVHLLVPAFDGEVPAIVERIVSPEGEEVARQGSMSAGHGHPVVGGQGDVGLAHLLDKLRHTGIASLDAQVGGEEEVERSAWLNGEVVLAAHGEIRKAQAGIEVEALHRFPLHIAVEGCLVGIEAAVVVDKLNLLVG